jgi:hypothetical protein
MVAVTRIADEEDVLLATGDELIEAAEGGRFLN